MTQHNPDADKFYCVDPQIVSQVGAMPALIHAILVAHQGSDGTTVMAQRQLATAAGGISIDSVARYIDKLLAARLIKAEHQYLDNRQRASRYQLVTASPGPGQNTKPQLGAGPQIAVPISSFLINGKTDEDSKESRQTRDEDRSTQKDRSTDKTRKKEHSHSLPPTELLGVARPLAGEVSRGEGRVVPLGSQGGWGEEPGDSPPSPWVPAGTKLSGALPLPFPESPMPKPLPPGSNGCQAIVHRDEEAWWLTSQFLAYLLARGDSPAFITDKRVERFHRNFFDGIFLHPLSEIAAILGLVFAVFSGEFPADMTRDLDVYIPPDKQERFRERKRKGEGTGPPRIEHMTRKVTNARQILHPCHYAQLRERLGRLRTSSHPVANQHMPPTPPTPVQRKSLGDLVPPGYAGLAEYLDELRRQTGQ